MHKCNNINKTSKNKKFKEFLKAKYQEATLLKAVKSLLFKIA